MEVKTMREKRRHKTYMYDSTSSSSSTREWWCFLFPHWLMITLLTSCWVRVTSMSHPPRPGKALSPHHVNVRANIYFPRQSNWLRPLWPDLNVDHDRVLSGSAAINYVSLHLVPQTSMHVHGGGVIQGFKHPPLALVFFFHACILERSVM